MSETGIRPVEHASGDPRLIAYEIVGKVTEAEMQDILRRVEAVQARGEKALIYQALVEMHGVEFSAMIAKMKGMKTLWKGVARVAVLSDSGVLRSLVGGVMDAITPMEMKAFELAERDAAFAWLLLPSED